MFKRKTLYTAVAASALVTLTAASIAAETVTSTATVTVQNAFDISEVAALSFGTLRATQNRDFDDNAALEAITYAEAAKLRIRTDGTAALNTAFSGNATLVASALTEIVAGTPAEFSITNAAPFTPLVVTTAAGSGVISTLTAGIVDQFELTTPGNSTSKFQVYIEHDDVRVSGGGNDNDLLAENGSGIQTDATGSVNLIVGGSIFMDLAATEIVDGVYTGNFSLEVSY